MSDSIRSDEDAVPKSYALEDLKTVSIAVKPITEDERRAYLRAHPDRPDDLSDSDNPSHRAQREIATDRYPGIEIGGPEDEILPAWDSEIGLLEAIGLRKIKDRDLVIAGVLEKRDGNGEIEPRTAFVVEAMERVDPLVMQRMEEKFPEAKIVPMSSLSSQQTVVGVIDDLRRPDTQNRQVDSSGRIIGQAEIVDGEIFGEGRCFLVVAPNNPGGLESEELSERYAMIAVVKDDSIEYREIRADQIGVCPRIETYSGSETALNLLKTDTDEALRIAEDRLNRLFERQSNLRNFIFQQSVTLGAGLGVAANLADGLPSTYGELEQVVRNAMSLLISAAGGSLVTAAGAGVVGKRLEQYIDRSIGVGIPEAQKVIRAAHRVQERLGQTPNVSVGAAEVLRREMMSGVCSNVDLDPNKMGPIYKTIDIFEQ